MGASYQGSVLGYILLPVWPRLWRGEPKQEQKEPGSAAAVRAQRASIPPLEEPTDIVHNHAADDIVLEALSPARTTCHFMYEVACLQDGSYAMAFVELNWFESTQLKLKDVSDPNFYADARRLLDAARLSTTDTKQPPLES